MWHYTEGLQNWNPVWPGHGIRILPGPSSLWLDARGGGSRAVCRATTTLGTLTLLRTPGHADATLWPPLHGSCLLDQSIVKKEFALSGSEQNPDLTKRDLALLLRSRLGRSAPGPVEDFKQHGADFVVGHPARTRGRHERLTGDGLLDHDEIARQVRARDNEIVNHYPRTPRRWASTTARATSVDRLFGPQRPHRLLDRPTVRSSRCACGS